MTPIEHWRTMDQYGNVMPWFTRPCLEWLDQYIKAGMRVWEYGCGQSSMWFASRGAIISGVDSDEKWILFPDVQFLADNRNDYLGFIWDYYDLIIIDGLYRDDCTEHALGRLKKGGYLIADNFEQPSADLADWPKTRELTKNLPLTIYKEEGHIDWKSAVWHNV